MQSIKAALNGISKSSVVHPHRAHIRIGDLSLSSSALPSALSDGKFTPYIAVMRDEDLSSRHKTKTLKSAWTAASHSYSSMTFNESFTIDMNAATDRLTVQLFDDNLFKDTLIAVGVADMTSLAAAPAGSGSGPISVALFARDKFYSASSGAAGTAPSTSHGAAAPSTGVAIGNVTLFCNLESCPTSATAASHASHTTTVAAAEPADGHKGGMMSGLGFGSKTSSTATSHHAKHEYVAVEPTTSTATTGGPIFNKVGDADALGGSTSAAPQALSTGAMEKRDAIIATKTNEAAIAHGSRGVDGHGKQEYEFNIASLQLDSEGLNRAYGTSHGAIPDRLDPYVMFKVNDRAPYHKTKTINLDRKGTAGDRTGSGFGFGVLTVNEKLHMALDHDDFVKVYLMDDNWIKDSCVGERVLTAAEWSRFLGAGNQSLQLFAPNKATSTAAAAASSGMVTGVINFSVNHYLLSSKSGHGGFVTVGKDITPEMAAQSLLLGAGIQTHIGDVARPMQTVAAVIAPGGTSYSASHAGAAGLAANTHLPVAGQAPYTAPAPPIAAPAAPVVPPSMVSHDTFATAPGHTAPAAITNPPIPPASSTTMAMGSGASSSTMSGAGGAYGSSGLDAPGRSEGFKGGVPDHHYQPMPVAGGAPPATIESIKTTSQVQSATASGMSGLTTQEGGTGFSTVGEGRNPAAVHRL